MVYPLRVNTNCVDIGPEAALAFALGLAGLARGGEGEASRDIEDSSELICGRSEEIEELEDSDEDITQLCLCRND